MSWALFLSRKAHKHVEELGWESGQQLMGSAFFLSQIFVVVASMSTIMPISFLQFFFKEDVFVRQGVREGMTKIYALAHSAEGSSR